MASLNQLQKAADLIRLSPKPIDRLPYTPEFDELHLRFEQEIGVTCSPHYFWWCLVDARKRGLVGPSKRRRRK